MIYVCSQNARRELVQTSPNLNGIDYVEVLGAAGCGTQLAIAFLNEVGLSTLTAANISIVGGAPVTAVSIAAPTTQAPTVVTVALSQTGDFSTYTLTLVGAAGSTDPPAAIDPQFASIQFSFKAGCPTPADCMPSDCCPGETVAPPDNNYLAKDYGGFLQVMLDRLAVLMPTWTETHAADLGIAITEVLAYAADHLSYQQDAVSTEAYISTARSRISLRRHARLVDYRIGEGCNARTLVVVSTAADNLTVPADTTFYVGVPGLPAAANAGDAVALQLVESTQPVFTALQPTTLYTAHNQIKFYTWEDSNCCLPVGATTATLIGTLSHLSIGDLLIFEEICGPDTGQPEDADPTHRCAVCLTGAKTTTDPLNGDEITEISWAPADALPFPLCISSTTDGEHGSVAVPVVSVARGNIVPADHGSWLGPVSQLPEQLGTVPPLPPAPDPSAGCSCGASSPISQPNARFYPGLAQSPLTFSVPFTTPIVSATGFSTPDPTTAVANVKVGSDDGQEWGLPPQPDLLGSDSSQRVFVPEIEADGTAFLRFGDGQYGMAPSPGLSFSANYRIGLGSVGNIGHDTLAHAVWPLGSPLAQTSDITGMRNPLAATGGIDPEDLNHIRQFAPFAYQTQQRCVTEADYGEGASQLTGGLAARGTMRWTGSWYTAFVSIDPTELTPTAMTEATTGLNQLRMLGTDVAVEAATIVGLVIELDVCVDPLHFQGDVYDALLEVFVTGDRCDGTPGVLNAANFTFGQTVYASPLIAAAQAVEGVVSVTLAQFTRMDAPWVNGVPQGYLTMARLEIPRCDNDPNHLDHGTFTLKMDGGK